MERQSSLAGRCLQHISQASGLVGCLGMCDRNLLSSVTPPAGRSRGRRDGVGVLQKLVEPDMRAVTHRPCCRPSVYVAHSRRATTHEGSAPRRLRAHEPS